MVMVVVVEVGVVARLYYVTSDGRMEKKGKHSDTYTSELLLYVTTCVLIQVRSAAPQSTMPGR